MTLTVSLTWWLIAYLAFACFTFGMFEVEAALNGRKLPRPLTAVFSVFWFVVVIVWGVVSTLAIAALLQKSRSTPAAP